MPDVTVIGGGTRWLVGSPTGLVVHQHGWLGGSADAVHVGLGERVTVSRTPHPVLPARQ